MNTMKHMGQWLIAATLFCFPTACGGDEETTSDDSLPFQITSADIDISGKNQTVRVPYAGKTYLFSVKTQPTVKWSVRVEEGDLVTVTPTGEQQGDGSIQITAAANPDKAEGRFGKVSITNSANDKQIQFIFEQKEKELYFPEGTEGQATADFKNPTSKFNIYYMKESDNAAVLWEKSFGPSPLLAQRAFDPDAVIAAAESVCDFLVDELGFANRTTSYFNKYKFLIFVFNDDEGTAYGGGNKNVGMMWLRPLHLQNPRFGILYHEMGHSFQSMASFDGAGPLNGPINEMTSQFNLLQKFPDWADLEPGHFKDFMKYTHLAFLHEENGYHSPYVLEYWTYKQNDRKFISRIWKEALDKDNRDPVAIYKRITNITQEQFNDEIYDAAARFMAWDMPRIKSSYAKYANQHTCKLKLITGKTFQITPERCPQNYGYNGIKLNVPAAGTKVQLSFTGMSGAVGFNVINGDKRGWRYGFVAVKKNKECVYGEMGKQEKGMLEFTVPADTEYLWLVVTGAPTEHWKHVVDQKFETDNQWPYQFTLIGTEPHSSVISN